MDYTEFKNEVADIKAELFNEFDLADALDNVDQYADGQQSVIYYSQAWKLVQMIRDNDWTLFEEAQDMWENAFIPESNLNKTMSQLAFCIWTVAINDALYGR